MTNELAQDQMKAPVEEIPTEQPLSTSVNDPEVEASMRTDLGRGVEEMKSRVGAIETKKITAKNKLKEFKINLLRDIYAMLQRLGVDLNDPEAIRNFLSELEAESPEMVDMFTAIFDGLSPDAPTAIDALDQPVEPAPGPETTVVAPAPESSPAPGSAPLPNEENGSTSTPNLMDKYSNLQEQVLRG